MSFVLRRVRPSDLQNWIRVNASGSLRATAKESWIAYLQANSGTGSTIRDSEDSFLRAAGASGLTMRDKWATYINPQSGATPKEKLRGFFK